MVLMQHFKFTPGSIEDVITTSAAFNFGIKDIARMRKELSALILNMSPLYEYASSSNEDVASTSRDLIMIGSNQESRLPWKPRCKQQNKCLPREPSPPR